MVGKIHVDNRNIIPRSTEELVQLDCTPSLIDSIIAN